MTNTVQLYDIRMIHKSLNFYLTYKLVNKFGVLSQFAFLHNFNRKNHVGVVLSNDKNKIYFVKYTFPYLPSPIFFK